MIDPIIIAATKEAVLGELGGSGGGVFTIPHFDLAAMGMPAVEIGGETVDFELDADTAEAVKNAMRGGLLSASFKIGVDGMTVVGKGTFNCFCGEEMNTYQGSVLLYSFGTAILFPLRLSENDVSFSAMVIQ